MSAEMSTMKGVRLGVLERTLLVNAPPLGAQGGLLIDAPEGTASAQKGYLRAARKLAQLGLLRRVRLRESTRARDPRRERPEFAHGRFWRNPDPTRRQLVNRVVVWATPLGAGIKLIYEHELTSGLPIRWTEEKLRLARRYEATHQCNPETAENAIDLVESRLISEDEERPGERFREVFPDDQMTTEQKYRWRCAAHLAHRRNPKLGSSGLWSVATETYRSTESTEALAEAAGPLPGRPRRNSPLRFKRLDFGLIVRQQARPGRAAKT